MSSSEDENELVDVDGELMDSAASLLRGSGGLCRLETAVDQESEATTSEEYENPKGLSRRIHRKVIPKISPDHRKRLNKSSKVKRKLHDVLTEDDSSSSGGFNRLFKRVNGISSSRDAFQRLVKRENPFTGLDQSVMNPSVKQEKHLNPIELAIKDNDEGDVHDLEEVDESISVITLPPKVPSKLIKTMLLSEEIVNVVKSSNHGPQEDEDVDITDSDEDGTQINRLPSLVPEKHQVQDAKVLFSKKPIDIEEYPPLEEREINQSEINDHERRHNPEFFSGHPIKTPFRYQKIRNYIIRVWKSERPSYISKTSVRSGLKDCGDVNAIGRVHAYLENMGIINFGSVRSFSKKIKASSIQDSVSNDSESPENYLKRQKMKKKLKRRPKEFHPVTIREDLSDSNEDSDACEREHHYIYAEKAPKHINNKIVEDPFLLVEPHQFSSLKGPPFCLNVLSDVLMVIDTHAHLCSTEVMGLLGGSYNGHERILNVTHVFPCNSMSTGIECEMDPQSEVEARSFFHENGVVVVGWYHSHPSFTPNPSIRDIENQSRYQALFETDDAEPFMGLIVSPYNQENVSDRSMFQYITISQEIQATKNHRIPYRLEANLIKCAEMSENLYKQIAGLVESYSTHPSRINMASSYRVGHGLTCLQKLLISMSSHLATDEENEVFILQRIRALFLDSYGLSMYNPSQTWESDECEASDSSESEEYSICSGGAEGDMHAICSGEESETIEPDVVSESSNGHPVDGEHHLSFESAGSDCDDHNSDSDIREQSQSPHVSLGGADIPENMQPTSTVRSLHSTQKVGLYTNDATHQEVIAPDTNDGGARVCALDDQFHPTDPVPVVYYHPDELHYMKIVEATHGSELEEVEEEFLDGGCVMVDPNCIYGVPPNILHYQIAAESAGADKIYHDRNDFRHQFNLENQSNYDGDYATNEFRNSLSRAANKDACEATDPDSGNETTTTQETKPKEIFPENTECSNCHMMSHTGQECQKCNYRHHREDMPPSANQHNGSQSNESACDRSETQSTLDDELAIESFFANISDGDDEGENEPYRSPKKKELFESESRDDGKGKIDGDCENEQTN